MPFYFIFFVLYFIIDLKILCVAVYFSCGHWMKALWYFFWLQLAASIFSSFNTFEGVSAFWDCFIHFNMRVNCSTTVLDEQCYLVLFSLSLSWFFLQNALCFGLQVFNLLEQVRLAWSRSWNHWQKAGHLCKSSNLPFQWVIFMQVS